MAKDHRIQKMGCVPSRLHRDGPSLRILNVVSHAYYGTVWFRSNTYRTMPDGEKAWISCLAANGGHTSPDYHGFVYPPTGDIEWYRCNHVRELKDLDSTPLRIAFYSGCETAMTPPTGQYNLVERSRLEGVDCAVGFTGTIASQNASAVGAHTYQFDFHYGFWKALYYGDTVTEALNDGEARVLAYHTYYNGWHKGAIRGTDLGL